MNLIYLYNKKKNFLLIIFYIPKPIIEPTNAAKKAKIEK